LIIPQQNSVFSHYPRLLDVRWQPCSGNYPMEYEVEAGISSSNVEQFHDRLTHAGLFSPWCVIQFVGAQPGRVRVRGVNALGPGEWSDFRHFTFTV
jgi:hypothetical protein